MPSAMPCSAALWPSSRSRLTSVPAGSSAASWGTSPGSGNDDGSYLPVRVHRSLDNRRVEGEMKRTFTIGQILSHYTGILMCDIGGVYEIANFLAQDSLFTHQLPRAGRDAKPWLLESLPWLSPLTLSEVTPENFRERLGFYSDKYGATH